MDHEFLRPILGEELFTQFNEKMGAATGITLANIADGSYIPKAKFDDANGKAKTLNATIADLNAKLAAAQQQSGDVAALNVQIAELNNKLTAKQTELDQLGLSYRIKDALRGMNARNVDVLLPLLKMDQISEKDGKIVGLQEQVDEIKKTDAYLFNTTPGMKGGFSGGQEIGGQPSTNESMNAAIRQVAGRG